MPSQEDYLDGLLRDVNGTEAPEENLQAAARGEDGEPGNSGSDMAEKPGADMAEKAGELSDTEEDSEEMDGASGVSSLSEEEIDRRLAESREAGKDAAPKEAFQGDVVDLLEGSDDSELQEIQDLLQKSDNNEAVGGDEEPLSRGTAPGADRGPADLSGAEGEGQLTSGKQKALEKKRLKAEKAAARKAAKEAKKQAKAAARAARKAEKAAKKAAKKAERDAKKGIVAAPETEAVPDAVLPEGEAAAPEETVDTAFLDSILSEAGKIAGAETISSATGNYDVTVDDIIPEEEKEKEKEKAAKEKTGTVAASSTGADSLGLDMDNLFGDSAAAESAMMAGGDADFPDFVALDGDAVTGVAELAGEDGEETKPKKKGFFSRFLEFLTEEDEEEEENENIQLSEENQEIIDDLDKEKAQKDKKGKKGKKKAKKGDSAEGGEEGGEGEGDGDKKGKKKKEKKPKKEKLPKEEEPVEPGKRLSLKKVLPIALICLTLGLAIIILTHVSVDYTGRKTARDAYYDGDYQTCYQNLYGKELNESEQIMFGKSESVLKIRLWLREYEMFAAEGAEMEALDSLIQSVNDYPALYSYASQWNAAGEVAQEYATILNLLYEKYGLTEDQARAIAAEPDDIEYTRQVNAITEGGAYGSWLEPEPVEEAPLQDELPAETELPESNFIDTNVSAQ